jgi:hypothetical protein
MITKVLLLLLLAAGVLLVTRVGLLKRKRGKRDDPDR